MRRPTGTKPDRKPVCVCLKLDRERYHYQRLRLNVSELRGGRSEVKHAYLLMHLHVQTVGHFVVLQGRKQQSKSALDKCKCVCLFVVGQTTTELPGTEERAVEEKDLPLRNAFAFLSSHWQAFQSPS